MTVSLDIPEESASDLVNGVCSATGWVAESGKTKAEWAKAQLVLWMKETAKRGLLMDQRTTIKAAVDAVTVS